MTQQEVKQQILGLDKEEQKELLYFIHRLLDADRYPSNSINIKRNIVKQYTEPEEPRAVL